MMKTLGVNGLRISTEKKPTICEKFEHGHLCIRSLNQLFLRGSYTETKIVTGYRPFFVICPFCTSQSIYPSIDFWQGSMEKLRFQSE